MADKPKYSWNANKKDEKVVETKSKFSWNEKKPSTPTEKQAPKPLPKMTPAEKKVYAMELGLIPKEPLAIPRQTTKTITAGKGKKVTITPQGKIADKNLVRPDNPFAPFMVNALNTASLGLLERNTNAIDTLREKAPISSTLGSMAGYLAPFSAVKGLVAKGTQTLGKRIATDALVGAGIDTASEVIKQKNDIGTAMKSVALSAAFGIAADGALTVLGKAFKNFKIPKDLEVEIKREVGAFKIDADGQVFKNGQLVRKLAKGGGGDIVSAEGKQFVDQYGNVRGTAEADLQLPQPKALPSSTQLTPSRNIERPFGLSPLDNQRINPQNKLQPPTIAQKTIGSINTLPKVETSLKPTMGKQEVAVALENADSFMAKINVKAKTKKTTGLGLKLRTDLVDKLAPLEDAEKAIRGKIASAEKSLYKTARNYSGTPEKAHEIIRTQLEPTLKAVQKQGYSIDELSAYAEAVHAKDVNLAGIKSGFTDIEIDDVIKKYSALEPQRLELQKLNNFVLDELVAGEVISKESANAMKSKWKNYMPLFRVMDDEKVEFGKGMGNTFANVASPIKTLKGSDKKVIDPIESMIKNVFQGINAAERNKVGLQLANLALDDVDGAFIRKLSDAETVGRKNVLNIKQAGQNVKYEVNPELYKAMLGLDKEASNVLIKILSKPASILRAGATLTPEFAMRNPMRDVVSAYVTSKSGFNPFTDFGRGLASVLKKDELYSKFLMSNAAYGESISMDRNVHREILEKVMRTPSKQFVNIISGKSLIGMLRKISDVTEKATKVGEFGKALKQGQTVEEAAYRARDLMDFARSGNSVKEANKVVAFLNANVQGKSKFLRAIKEDPAGVTARIGKAIALPSIAVFTAQQTLSNDEQKAIIQDAPEWLKDTFWLIPIPGTNQVARIPKPFDFAVFGNTLERFLAYTVNNDKDAFDNFARSTIKQQSIPVMLTGLVPIIEGMTNYSFFRDAPIVPQREAYLEKKDQFDTYTSELSKKVAGGLTPILGEGSNFTSPRIVDNTIRGVTAGMGGYALDIFDIILGKETKKPAKNLSQYPLLKGFLVNENSSGKSMETLYNDKDKLTREKNSAKLNKLPFTQQQGLKKATSTADRVADITKLIREATNSQTLSPEQKRIKINELTDIRNGLTREYAERK